ncbi:helix-turn-helix domain-containing protein [Bacillus mycoides]|nr:helix-turn-helix domain-containing protein [Bacillus mycoides]MED1287533.1 helix-turn-helix domain-containing protein [Bacillus mycoides]
MYDTLRFHKKGNMTVKQICECINASREALYKKLEDKRQ